MTKFVSVSRTPEGADQPLVTKVPERALSHYEARGWSRHDDASEAPVVPDTLDGGPLESIEPTTTSPGDLAAGDATASGTADSNDGKSKRTRGASGSPLS